MNKKNSKVHLPNISKIIHYKNYFKADKERLGQRPGIVIKKDEEHEPVSLALIQYTEEEIHFLDPENWQEAAGIIENNPDKNHWLNINGLNDSELLTGLGERFQIHNLLLEDIQSLDQRPKYEDHENFLSFIMKMISFDTDDKSIESEQVSILLGKNVVMTFQERKGDVFDSIRVRLGNGTTQIRKFGASYLFYALADAIVDHYFIVLESISDHLTELETRVLDNPHKSILNEIFRYKRELIFFRRSVWPLREAIFTLIRDKSSVISKNVMPYWRDLYDHAIQVIDTTEIFREVVTGVLDVYYTNVSNKMNDVMKVLTIFSTIFIPLTFIAGVYGMNFQYMPELDEKVAYPVVWVVMIAVAIEMLIFFKRKKW